jgi:hypothetical protein
MPIFSNPGWESRTGDLRPNVKSAFPEKCSGCFHESKDRGQSPCDYCKFTTSGVPREYQCRTKD